MLQDLRDNLHGVAKVVLVAIIIIPFALFGVDALFLSGSAVEEAANVNGESISELELQRAVANHKQQLLTRFKDLDPSLLDDEKLKGSVIQQLIRKEVVEQSAVDQGMGISSRTIYDLLLDVPEFLTDGKFDADRYDFYLRQMGYTPTSYSKLLVTELLVNQFLQGVVTTGFSTEKEQALLAAITEQTRDFYYLTIPSETISESIEVSKEDLQAYYDSHSDEFMTQEQVVVEYLELQPEDLISEVSVDQEQIDDLYQARVDAAEGSSSRQAAHILLEEQEDGSHLTKIQTLLDELKTGADFAALAREHSEDFITAELGGDLGFNQKGDLPEVLESALDELAVGGVSGVVESESGVHILKLMNEKAADIPSRETLEPGLRKELELQLAMDLMPERIEMLKDLSYNATSLQDTADEVALDLKVSKPFSRLGGQGVFSNKAVVNAVYSDTVLEEGYASEVIELADDHVLVLALRERIAPELQELDLVKDDIISVIKKQRTEEQLIARGKELQQRVEGGESIEDTAKAEGLEWQVKLDAKRLGGDLDGRIRQQVFSMKTPGESPVVEGLFLNNGDYVLISLTSVEQGDYSKLTLQQKRSMASATASVTGGQEYQAYEELLFQSADVASNY